MSNNEDLKMIEKLIRLIENSEYRILKIHKSGVCSKNLEHLTNLTNTHSNLISCKTVLNDLLDSLTKNQEEKNLVEKDLL